MRKDNPNNLFEEQRISKIQTVPVIRDASIVLSRVLRLLKLRLQLLWEKCKTEISIVPCRYLLMPSQTSMMMEQ